MVLFVVPVTLLGTASFAIRLALSEFRQPAVSPVASTPSRHLESFVGTFLPVLILIPWLALRTFWSSAAFC